MASGYRIGQNRFRNSSSKVVRGFTGPVHTLKWNSKSCVMERGHGSPQVLIQEKVKNHSNLRWFTRCRTRIKAKKGSVARRFIKQQQQQTNKRKHHHQQTKPLSWVAKTDGSQIFWILWASGSGSVDLERSCQNPPTDHGGGLSYYNHTTNYFAKT